MAEKILSVDFEVFGRVQKVFFRKCTQEQGKLLGLRGWCQNTPNGTVIGNIQGPPNKVLEMKKWLQEVGSPLSRIEKVNFEGEKYINNHTHLDFTIIRKK